MALPGRQAGEGSGRGRREAPVRVSGSHRGGVPAPVRTRGRGSHLSATEPRPLTRDRQEWHSGHTGQRPGEPLPALRNPSLADHRAAERGAAPAPPGRVTSSMRCPCWALSRTRVPSWLCLSIRSFWWLCLTKSPSSRISGFSCLRRGTHRPGSLRSHGRRPPEGRAQKAPPLPQKAPPLPVPQRRACGRTLFTDVSSFCSRPRPPGQPPARAPCLRASFCFVLSTRLGFFRLRVSVRSPLSV